LLDVLTRLAPNPTEGNPPPFYRSQPDGGAAEPFQAVPDPDRHVLAHVFKVISDPFIGKLGVFRVHQGTVRKDAQLFVAMAGAPSRSATCTACRARSTSRSRPWCRVTSARWPRSTRSNSTACCTTRTTRTGSPQGDRVSGADAGPGGGDRRKGDEQRLFDVLHKFEIEDPCFRVERHPTTNETVLRGLGRCTCAPSSRAWRSSTRWN